jgi:Mg-chelatase subunit ChlI
MAFVSIATAVASIGVTAYGLKNNARAQSDAKKQLKLAEQTPRQRIDYINTTLLPKAKTELTKAQAGGDATKIKTAQNKIADLQDEAALLTQTAADQHAQATGLFSDVNAPATSAAPIGSDKTLLLIGGALAVVSLGAALALAKRKK